MISRWVWLLSAIFLTVIIAGSFLYPHVMVSPGKLMSSHRDIEQNCFACHAPFFGVAAERCTACHVPSVIGLRSTKGAVLVKKLARAPFHQALIEQNCIACHNDHLVTAPGQETPRRFAHSLLKPELRSQCQSCHVPPNDQQHNGARLPCAQCHQASGWKPATFDHGRFFPLEGDHNVSCQTCHAGGNYKIYTCYGCHAHEKNRMISEHLEEGIRNIDNCVRCHNGQGSPNGERGESGDDD